MIKLSPYWMKLYDDDYDVLSDIPHKQISTIKPDENYEAVFYGGRYIKVVRIIDLNITQIFE